MKSSCLLFTALSVSFYVLSNGVSIQSSENLGSNPKYLRGFEKTSVAMSSTDKKVQTTVSVVDMGVLNTYAILTSTLALQSSPLVDVVTGLSFSEFPDLSEFLRGFSQEMWVS